MFSFWLSKAKENTHFCIDFTCALPVLIIIVVNNYYCTCVLTWACVCSNSSSFMLFETGTWNTDMLATLLHSDLTLAIATMASSRVNRQLKAKLSNFSSKGYEGTSGWKPKVEGKEITTWRAETTQYTLYCLTSYYKWTHTFVHSWQAHVGWCESTYKYLKKNCMKVRTVCQKAVFQDIQSTLCICVRFKKCQCACTCRLFISSAAWQEAAWPVV